MPRLFQVVSVTGIALISAGMPLHASSSSQQRSLSVSNGYGKFLIIVGDSASWPVLARLRKWAVLTSQAESAGSIPVTRSTGHPLHHHSLHTVTRSYLRSRRAVGHRRLGRRLAGRLCFASGG